MKAFMQIALATFGIMALVFAGCTLPTDDADTDDTEEVEEVEVEEVMEEVDVEVDGDEA